MADLRIHDLHKSFGDTEVLSGIDLAVASGEFVSLLGPSGCGKSTMLRCIAGLESATSGRIEVDDTDLSDLPPERRGLGMMFQSYALFPHMTALDNVRFPLRMAGRGTKQEQLDQAAEALEQVQMGGFGDRRPTQLSGGQQQRVALARAIVGQPPVLLLDEPLSNLDARLREDMQLELLELHRRLGLTTIFVTHDQDEALSLSDRVVLLADGTIEQAGTPEDVYRNPATAFAADFMGAANVLGVAVADDEVRLADTPVQTASITTTLESDAAGLIVRQEDVRIVDDNAAWSLPGDVVARAYRGSVVQYVVVLADGQRVRCLASADGPAVDTGPCRITWPADRARVVASAGQ